MDVLYHSTDEVCSHLPLILIIALANTPAHMYTRTCTCTMSHAVCDHIHTYSIRRDVLGVLIESRTSKTAFKHFYQLQHKPRTWKKRIYTGTYVQYSELFLWGDNFHHFFMVSFWATKFSIHKSTSVTYACILKPQILLLKATSQLLTPMKITHYTVYTVRCIIMQHKHNLMNSLTHQSLSNQLHHQLSMEWSQNKCITHTMN